MKKATKRAVTLSDLASQMRAGFEDVKEYTDTEVEGLARMTQDGFASMEKSLKEHTKIVLEEFRRLNADIKDIKTTLGPTVVIVAEQEKRIQNLESRLSRVEREVGIASVA